MNNAYLVTSYKKRDRQKDNQTERRTDEGQKTEEGE
jgi:hypothetical protein